MAPEREAVVMATLVASDLDKVRAELPALLHQRLVSTR
jgi:hypothetical protein